MNYVSMTIKKNLIVVGFHKFLNLEGTMITQKQLKNMNDETRELIALEALLRRASQLYMPYVLKGSLLTKQYFGNSMIRDVEDIDFLYIEKIKNVEKAHQIFTNWIIRVTELDLDDGVKFRSFRENAFWRGIDYAMADDFPTINTDIAYVFTDEHKREDDYHELSLDISFNLEMDTEPVSLEYKPIFGDKFIVPYTVPLSIQVAWKLHQTIVRPRFKDLYDLKYLLSHSSYDEFALKETLQALVNECSMDKSIKATNIKKVFTSDLSSLYNLVANGYYLKKYSDDHNYTRYFMNFILDLRNVMNAAGINEHSYCNLPIPNKYKEI